MKHKRVTLEQIAKEINISRVTISKYLNGHGKLRPETQRAVAEALESHGYRQNLAAKTLAMNRVFTIGFICFESTRSPYFLKTILSGVEEAARQFMDYGLRIRTKITDIDYPEEQLAALDEVLATNVDALAIIPNDIFRPEVANRLREKVEQVVASGIPVATVNRDIPDSRRSTYIGCDYEASGAMAAELLAKFVKEGDVLVALASRSSQLIDIKFRLKGMHRVFSHYPGITIAPYFYFEDDDEAFANRIQSFTASNSRAKGLLDISYRLQHVVDLVQQHPANSNDPGHLYIAGFDQYLGYEEHLRTGKVDCIISQDLFAQGYEAVSYLFQLLLQDVPLIPVVPIRNEIIIASNLGSYAQEAPNSLESPGYGLNPITSNEI